MGGSDDPSNIIRLSVAEHAEAHKKLFETHGQWEDELAWKALTGQISEAEIIHTVQTKSGHDCATKRSQEGTHHFLGGEVQRKLAKRMVSEGTHNLLGGKIQSVSNQNRLKNKTHHLLGPDTNNKMLADGKHPSQMKITCVHCQKLCDVANVKRWHFDNCKLRH